MKLVHISLCGPVTDNLNYQDNLLPKYHKKLGYEVFMIASRYVYNKKGDLVKTVMTKYSNSDGVNMIRLNIKNDLPFNFKFKKYHNLSYYLNKIHPNIIFVHGVQFLDLKTVQIYKSNNPNVKIFVDNHADYNNSATNLISKYILHGIIWRHYAKIIEPYSEMFFGVTPSRVDFLIERYKINAKKVKYLPMGGDDLLINKVIKKNNLKAKWNLEDSNIVLVTGGKIDKYKTDVSNLIKAIIKSKNHNLKLLIFGSVDKSQLEILNLLSHDRIFYLGWLNLEETYEVLSISDVAVFPGLHSVLWEQTVSLGTPICVKRLYGNQHIDIGGNCILLNSSSEEEFDFLINKYILDSSELEKLKVFANQKSKEFFWYSNISKKSLLIK